MTTVPPSGHNGSAANWPAPDQTMADMMIAAGWEMPAAPVLAPKIAPRMSVLGKNVRAATKPSRMLRLGAATVLEGIGPRVRAERSRKVAGGRGRGGARTGGRWADRARVLAGWGGAACGGQGP